MKKWSLWAAAVFAAIAVLLIAASVYLSSAALRSQLVGRLNQSLPGRLQVEDHTLSLLSGGLTLSGVTLDDQAGVRVLAVERLRVRLLWPALLQRTLHFSFIGIEQAQLNLLVDAQGRLNLTHAFLSEGQGRQSRPVESAWQVKVGELLLKGVQASYQNASAGWSARLEGLEGRGQVDSARRRGRLRLRAAALEVHGQGLDRRRQGVELEAAYQDGASDPLSLALRIPGSEVKAKGRLDRIDGEAELSLTFDLNLALGELRDWLPQLPQMHGRLSGTLAVQGHLKDPSASARLQISGEIADLAVQSASLAARMAQRQVEVDEVRIAGPAGEVAVAGRIDLRPVFPHSFDRQGAGIDALSYVLELRGRRLRPQDIPLLDFPWGGTWQTDLQLAGRGVSPAAVQGDGTIVLQVEGLRAVPKGRPAPAGLTAEARWAGRTLHLRSARGSLGAHRLQASGSLDWAQGRYEAEAQLQSPRLKELGGLLGVRLPAGSGTLTLVGKGALQAPAGRAVLSARDLSFDAWRFGRLEAEADLGADGTLRFSRLELKNKNGALAGRGRLDLMRPGHGLYDDPQMDFRFQLDALALSDFLARPVDGDLQLNGDLHVAGRLLHPTAELHIKPSPVRWEQATARAEGRMRWDNGQLTVPSLKLASGRSLVTLEGGSRWRDPRSGRFSSDPQVQAEIKSTRLELQEWLTPWLPGVKGVFALNASLEGPLSDIQGTFQIRGRDLETGVQSFSSLQLEGRLAGATLHVDRLAAALAPGQTLEGRGWFAFDRRFEGRLAGRGIDLSLVQVLHKGPKALAGRLNLELSGGGSLEHPRLAARLQLQKPRLGDLQWEDVDLRAELREGEAILEADSNFHLTGRYRPASGAFELSAQFQNTDLKPYLAVLAGDKWAGRISGSLQAGGNRRDLGGIEAHVTLSQTELSFQQTRLLQMDHLQAVLRNGTLEMAPVRLTLMQEGELTVQARGPIDRDLAVQAVGELPVAALAAFTERIGDPAGRLRIDLAGRGPWSRLQWRGDVALAQVGFSWEEWDQVVQEVSGRVRLNSEQVTIENLTGRLDDGGFRLDGQLQLAGWKPGQGRLTFKAQALPLHWPGTMDLVLGADLTLKGDLDRSVLEGKVTLLEGSYYRNVNFNLVSRITERRRAEPPARTSEPPAWLKSIALNIAVDYRYPLLVDNNLARLQVAPDLKIGGTAAEPVISGRAAVAEGELFFRRKTFTVNRGVVDFNNPYRTEPTLDIQAKTRIRQWEITLAATGPPDNLEFTLSSDPPESDSNILSLILVGRTSSEVAGGGGGATTEQMLASLAESAWGEEIKKRTGVDILEVETGAKDETQDPDRIQVTVGKQLSSRFTVKYSLEAAGGETIQRAASEYRFLERLIASGFQDTAGVYGGELLFRIEFR